MPVSMVQVDRRVELEHAVSLPRFAVGGALGGFILSGIVNLAAGPGPELMVVGPVFALAGAVSAAGTLAIARRAEKRASIERGAETRSLPSGR